MDIVDNPLDLNVDPIFRGYPLLDGQTPYKNITYFKEEEEDFYTKLSGNTLRELIEERIEILQKIYKKEDTAVLLSGGVDSSIATLLWKPKEVWTLDNRNIPNLDETNYVSLVASKIKAKINLVKPKKNLNHLKSIIAKNGILSRHAGLFALDALLKQIKQAGYKHVLMGSHADYCFGHFKIGFVLELLKLINTNPVFEKYSTVCQKAIGEPEQIFLKLIGVSFQDTSKIIEFTKKYDFVANKLHELLGKFDDQEQYNECFLSNYYGLNLIDPFKSKYIEDFAFSYNKQLDYTEGNPKEVLKQSFQHLLPQEIINRQHKVGCCVPYWKWFSSIRPGNYEQLIFLFLKWHIEHWIKTRSVSFSAKQIKQNVNRIYNLYYGYSTRSISE